VDVCPVDCIHPRKDELDYGTAEMLYIHPDECIDCGACVPAAQMPSSPSTKPEKWADFIPRNASYYDRG
jgi:ferredoxin